MKIWSSQLHLQCKHLQIYPTNFRDFNRIWTLGICVNAAVLYQLSYEDPHIASRPICWLYFRSLHHLHPIYISFHSRVKKNSTNCRHGIMPRSKNGGRQEFHFEWRELDIIDWAQKHFTYFESNFSAPSACVHVSLLFFFRNALSNL